VLKRVFYQSALAKPWGLRTRGPSTTGPVQKGSVTTLLLAGG
jgi:hypothetical protein